MAPRSDPALDAAIVAYVGRGRLHRPTADAEAARAVAPERGDELLAGVTRAIGVSDTLAFDEVAPFDAGLRARVTTRLRALLPELGDPAVEALAWRWGYLQFGQ